MLATIRDNNAIGESLHCLYNFPNTILTWYRDSVQITNGTTRTIHDNGTLEFHPLIANADLTEEGVEYHCILSNAFGSVISRTAILKLASKLFYIIRVMLRGSSCVLLGILSFHFKLFNLASISVNMHSYMLEVVGIAVLFYFPDSEA